MILPIGHEESGVRRLPWVSFGVMILCVAAFVATGRGSVSPRAEQEIEERMTEAFEYYLERPYLDPPESLAEALDDGSDATPGIVDFIQEALPRVEVDADTRHAEQAELERLVARASAAYDEHPLVRWGLVPSVRSLPTFVTHMFLHVGWLHLVGNFLIFYLAAPFIEDVWGRPLFAGFYLAAGIVAALIYIGFRPESTVPMVGASGAIAGVMGAFLVRYRRTRIRFLYIFGFFIRGTFSAPAWIMLALWFGQQIFLALMTQSMSDEGGVAYWAHVGGFGFGAAAAALVAHLRIEERFLHGKLEEKVSVTVIDTGRMEEALAARDAGDGDAALRLLLEEAERQPGQRDVALGLWSVAAELGRPAEAAPAMLGAVHHALRRREGDVAEELWSELMAVLPQCPAPAQRWLQLARGWRSAGREDRARQSLRRALLGRPDGATALAIARTAEGLDRCLVQGAARLALDSRSLDPAERELARGLLETAPASSGS